MPSVSIRGFRNAKRLKTWLRAGRTIELRERDQVIARIIPEGLPQRSVDWPDIAAMRREIFGDRVLLGTTLATEERGRY
jgi:antitoxin (DNA-binding transcriptional repressor) of toxin-antitoxin stability system